MSTSPAIYDVDSNELGVADVDIVRLVSSSSNGFPSSVCFGWLVEGLLSFSKLLRGVWVLLKLF